MVGNSTRDLRKKLGRLSEHLGGAVELYAKREDCNSGLAGGGNKIRKLEYIVPDAIASNADTLVTIGGGCRDRAGRRGRRWRRYRRTRPRLETKAASGGGLLPGGATSTSVSSGRLRDQLEFSPILRAPLAIGEFFIRVPVRIEHLP
jgi:hypothetical protein